MRTVPGTIQTLQHSIAALANGAAYGLPFITNTDGYPDGAFRMKIKTGASGAGASGVVNVYVLSSMTGGDWCDNYTGNMGVITPVNPVNARHWFSLNAVATSTSYPSCAVRWSSKFSSPLPAYLGIYIVNNTGGALSTVKTDFEFQFQFLDYSISNDIPGTILHQ